jgi:L-asparaginase
MKAYRHVRCLVAILALTVPTAAQAKPKVEVLATGGTIAGAQASSSEVGYKSGTFSVDDLIKALPQVKDVADLAGEQVANIGSQTMNHDVWLKVAKRVNEELSPQKARILLMLALMNTNDPVKLQQVFMQY